MNYREILEAENAAREKLARLIADIENEESGMIQEDQEPNE